MFAKAVLRAGDDTLWTHLLQELHREKPGPQPEMPSLQTAAARGNVIKKQSPHHHNNLCPLFSRAGFNTEANKLQ